jgi:hypothetical protein
VNRVCLQGLDRYDEASDFASVAVTASAGATPEHGCDHRREGDGHGGQGAEAAAWRTPSGLVVTPCNVGQQLFDVVTVTSAAMGVASLSSASSAAAGNTRVRRGRGRFDSILELGVL